MPPDSASSLVPGDPSGEEGSLGDPYWDANRSSPPPRGGWRVSVCVSVCGCACVCVCVWDWWRLARMRSRNAAAREDSGAEGPDTPTSTPTEDCPFIMGGNSAWKRGGRSVKACGWVLWGAQGAGASSSPSTPTSICPHRTTHGHTKTHTSRMGHHTSAHTHVLALHPGHTMNSRGKNSSTGFVPHSHHTHAQVHHPSGGTRPLTHTHTHTHTICRYMHHHMTGTAQTETQQRGAHCPPHTDTHNSPAQTCQE